MEVYSWENDLYIEIVLENQAWIGASKKKKNIYIYIQKSYIYIQIDMGNLLQTYWEYNGI